MFDGHYESLPCTDSNQEQVKNDLNAKIQLFDCVQTGNCVTTVKSSGCNTSRKKRDTSNGMTMTVVIKSDVDLSKNPMNIEAVLQNNSGICYYAFVPRKGNLFCNMIIYKPQCVVMQKNKYVFPI